MSPVFRSLRTRNYRLFFSGQVISTIGTWIQFTAASWLVLELTGSGLAVGIALALQFGPMVFGPWGGLLADRHSKRRILIATQSLYLLLATVLGFLTTTGTVTTWMVYLLSFLFGLVQIVDTPTRQAFASELVGPEDVMNAVSLNNAVNNTARIVGPAIAGLVIAQFGIGVCFLMNAASFLAVLVALLRMRDGELHLHADRNAAKGRGQIRAGLRYALSDIDLYLPLALMAVVGTLGLNYMIILPLLARFTFHSGAGAFGTLSSALAAGNVVGALYSASLQRPTRKLLILATIAFGVCATIAAFAPTLLTAHLLLPFVGLTSQLFITTTNSSLQVASRPEMRGRVMSLFLMLMLGTTPVGGPLAGWVSETWSPRAAIAMGGIATLGVGGVAGLLLLRRRRGLYRSAVDVEPVPAEDQPV